jgi:hypothetical protein
MKRTDGERPIYSPTCVTCAHLHLYSKMGKETCDAFPKGIPEAIWREVNGHRKPVPGDNGLTYTPVLKPSPAVAVED